MVEISIFSVVALCISCFALGFNLAMLISVLIKRK